MKSTEEILESAGKGLLELNTRLVGIEGIKDFMLSQLSQMKEATLTEVKEEVNRIKKIHYNHGYSVIRSLEEFLDSAREGKE